MVDTQCKDVNKKIKKQIFTSFFTSLPVYVYIFFGFNRI